VREILLACPEGDGAVVEGDGAVVEGDGAVEIGPFPAETIRGARAADDLIASISN
jgi:hypothetical protein